MWETGMSDKEIKRAARTKFAGGILPTEKVRHRETKADGL
jgi:hypothetical protein